MLTKDQVKEIAEEVANQVAIRFSSIVDLSEEQVQLLRKYIKSETLYCFTGDVSVD
jgi:hypothetical protein